jgi:hypothetical protein
VINSDIKEMHELMPAIRRYEKLANKYGIFDIFQDNGGKTLQTILVTNLIVSKGRMGNDAKDIEGNEYELKTINIKSTACAFSTNHHLNSAIIEKYRKAKWIFSVYKGIELFELWEIDPKDLEFYFSKWEQKIIKENKDINNPKIPLNYVRKHGNQIEFYKG